jgi:hypothetical protein
MPTNLLIVCTAVGALAAALLMNWAIRKNKQLKRQGRDWERAAVGMPVGAMIASLSGFGVGPGDDDQDAGLDGVDGDTGDGE